MYSIRLPHIKFFQLVPPRMNPFSFEVNPVHEGDYVQVNCLVAGGDLPIEIKWKLNDVDVQKLKNGITTTNGKRSSMLTVESITYTEAGNYTCIAKNRAGESAHLAELQVNGLFITLISI